MSLSCKSIREMLVANANLELVYFMLFGFVYFTHLTKFANGSPLRLLTSGKFQAEKSPCMKEKK